MPLNLLVAHDSGSWFEIPSDWSKRTVAFYVPREVARYDCNSFKRQANSLHPRNLSNYMLPLSLA
jgi:hypothetical protein